MDNMETTIQLIPFYSHPHVWTVIIDNTFYDETVASAVDPDAMPFSVPVVTGADEGIDNTFVRLTSEKTKKAIFGAGNFQKYGQSSLQADALFNGSTAVWFCRVLPDDATYANIVFLAHYREGKILDDLGQETGKVRMEIKFSTAYATKDYVSGGATTNDEIDEFARSLASSKSNPQTGYKTVPICFVRSIGRGKYGNKYSMSIQRDKDAEKEYELKMYKFNLISDDPVTHIQNVFSGSLYQTTKYDMSTLISDVLDQFSTGSCPVYIKPYEDSFETLYDFYKTIVAKNAAYVTTGGSDDDKAEYLTAAAVTKETFDPLFGYVLNTRNNETIPYYKNYTVKATGEWEEPDLVIPNTVGATKPLNTADWAAARVGSRVLVVADPLNDGYRWIYTVTSINPANGNIIYDEGMETAIDDDQYDGINIAQTVGQSLTGGSDGCFEQIEVDGELRAPNAAEMKLLLSREYVRAFRGEKDRKILSPARVDLDFMFDANYNMSSSAVLPGSGTILNMYANSTVLTDEDAKVLSVTATAATSGTLAELADVNVKQAMYDLNEFRNRNGMEADDRRGAGCSLYLDCGLVGSKNVNINYELGDLLSDIEEFEGRATSVDLGYYEIFDPVTGKRIQVTVDYYIAKNLIPHIMRNGLNMPFAYSYATMTAIQKSKSSIVSGDMIRGSFRPDIDLIDWDVKERLYKARINYWLVTDEGRNVQRACQNTRQVDASALLEENNVRILNTLKKGLDRACRGYLYNWNEPTARKAYTQTQMQIYKPWIGTMVQDLEIKFEANEWEQERMIMHCYAYVAFRDIIKRIILEINIQRPQYTLEGSET